jgi:uncharacterized protein Yka (UPF0111/DUF47 family)
MGTRGRKSKGDLSIASSQNVISIKRPRVPRELTDEQSQVWDKIVKRMPADWFTEETHPLLTQLCRHVVRARRVSQLIQQMEDSDDGFDVSSYSNLLKDEESQSRAIAALSGKMRLTHSSTKRQETTPRPQSDDDAPWQRPS